MKPDKISVGLHGLKSNISKLAIGLDGFNFSRRIAGKYGIFPKSGSMPALIFRRLFGIRTANNSSHGRLFNNYINLQKFYYLINPLQKSLGYFSNPVISTHDIRACTKIQTSMRYYGKTDAGPGYQNRSIQTVTSAKKTDKVSTNINAATPGTDTPSTRKAETIARYENNVTEQTRDGQKQFISVFHKPPLYTRNILTSINPITLSYLQRIFNFEASTNINAATQGADARSVPSVNPVVPDYQYKKNIETISSKPDRMISAAKKLEIPLARKSGTPQGTDIPSLLQIRALKDDENIAPEQIGEEKNQFIQELHRASVSSKTVLTSANPVTLGYLHRNNIETAGSKIDRKIPVAGTMEIPSAGKSGATQVIETPSLQQTGTLKDDKNIAPEQSRKGKKQFIPVLHKPPLYTRNILTSVNPVKLSYLQKIFNFEFTGSKPGRTVVSARKMEIPSTKKPRTLRDIDAPSLMQTRTLKDDKNIAPEQIGEEKNQFIRELHRAPVSSKTVLTSANPVTLGYQHKNNIETPSPRQTGTLKDDRNIAPEQIGEGKKQFISVFHKPPIYTRNILTSVINPVTLSYLKRTFNFEASTNINAAAQGADASSYQQIRNIQNLQYENVFNHDTKPGGGDLVPAFHNIMALKGSINPSHNNVLQTPLINLKRVDHIMKNGQSQEVNENIVYNSRELVLKKPAQQKTESVPENKGDIQTGKVSSKGMRDDLVKELVKEKPMHEIGLIADKVYKIIERRISIEKDRRGLF